MSRFPTDKHLASWAGLCPGHHESAGKRRSGKARKGNPALRTAMCEAAWAASHGKNTYLTAQFRRFKRRFGTRSETKAIFALAHTMIVIVWHVLHDEAVYDELGANYFERCTDSEARQRNLIRQLEALGHKVTIEPRSLNRDQRSTCRAPPGPRRVPTPTARTYEFRVRSLRGSQADSRRHGARVGGGTQAERWVGRGTGTRHERADAGDFVAPNDRSPEVAVRIAEIGLAGNLDDIEDTLQITRPQRSPNPSLATSTPGSGL